MLPALKRMSGLFVTGAPVLMLGLVMSGVGVWTAAVVEVVVAVAVMGYALSTFWLAVLLSRRYAFDGYERLRPMKRGGQAETEPETETAEPQPADVTT